MKAAVILLSIINLFYHVITAAVDYLHPVETYQHYNRILLLLFIQTVLADK